MNLRLLLKIYDQTFQQINGNKANNVQFKIASKTVTLDQIKQKYGKNYNYQPPLSKTKQVRQRACTVIKLEKETSFYAKDGYVISATLS